MTIARKTIVTEAERRTYFKQQARLARRETPEDVRVANELHKLGDRAKDRISAIETWAKGRNLTKAQYAALSRAAEDAAGVELIEALTGAAAGNPGKPALSSRMFPKRKVG